MSEKEKHLIKKRSFEASILRSEGENSDENTIDLVFSTGHKGLRHDWDESYYEELEVSEEACDLTRLNAGAPFLADHWANTTQVLGVVERAWIENGLGKATVRLSKRADVAGIVQDIKEGILKNISVGYRVLEFTDKTKKGDKYRTLLATKWQPMEISSVAIGFDPNAQTLRSETNENEVTIITKKGAEMEEKPTTEETPATETPKEETVVTTETPEVAAEEVARKAVEEFQQRSEEIQNAVKVAGLDAELAQDMVKRNLSMADASAEIFKRLEERAQQQKNKPEQAKEKKMEKRAMVIEALKYRADSNAFKCSDENELKGKSVLEIFEAIVPREAGEKDSAYAKRAITSADLSDILVDAANKIVDEYPYEEEFIHKKLAKPMVLRDFKDTNIVDLSEYALGTPASEGADYPSASLTDTKEKIKLRQRGVLVILSLIAVINDDLDMLTKLPDTATKSGLNDLEAAFFGVLNANANMADGKALFHADHNNLIVDVTGVDVESLDLAEQKLASQTKLNKKLKLKPKYILVHPKHALAARRLVGAQVSSDPDKFNPYAGSGIEVLISSELTEQDSWYVFADPKKFAAIVTGTMQGMETPKVASDEEFGSSSLRMKVEFHNNAAAANAQGVVKLTIDVTP